jgi:hypothetical protein
MPFDGIPRPSDGISKAIRWDSKAIRWISKADGDFKAIRASVFFPFKDSMNNIQKGHHPLQVLEGWPLGWSLRCRIERVEAVLGIIILPSLLYIYHAVNDDYPYEMFELFDPA